MTLAGNNQQIVIAVNVVHKSIFPVNSSAPSLAVFKRLGFADTLRQTVSFNVLNKGVFFFRVLRSSICHCRYSSHAMSDQILFIVNLNKLVSGTSAAA